MRRVLAVVILTLVGTAARADEPITIEPPELTPEALVTPTPEQIAKTEAEEKEAARVARGALALGPDWGPDEYLLWWLKAQPMPPLLVRGRAGVPRLGDGSSTLMFGPNSSKSQEHSGGRFVSGWAGNSEQTIGTEVIYFFLGTRTRTLATESDGGPGDAALSRPFINANNGAEDAFSVVQPGVTSGRFEAVASTRMQGVEINAFANLFPGCCFKLDALVGFRFLQLHEGIRFGQRTNTATGPQSFVIEDIVDQVDGHNRFYGGQFGLRADWRHGPAFIEVHGKLAVGRTSQIVRIDSLTSTTTNGLPDVVTLGGFFGHPSNLGRFTADPFAILPEATVRLGWQESRYRCFVGYNFLYLSQVARPGDQIDRTINPTPALGGPERPVVDIASSSFWAQGLMIGCEWRY